MNVVVVDAAALPPGVDFPPLAADRFGWQQYLDLGAGEIPERCWRADVVVTLATRLGERELGGLARLQLVVAAGDAAALVDLALARVHGFHVVQVPGSMVGDAAGGEQLCRGVVNAIDAFMRGERGHCLV